MSACDAQEKAMGNKAGPGCNGLLTVNVKKSGAQDLKQTLGHNVDLSLKYKECVQLLRQVWSIYHSLQRFLKQLHILLFKLRAQIRQSQNVTRNPFNKGREEDDIHLLRLMESIALQAYSKKLKTYVNNTLDIGKQYVALSRYHIHHKLLLFIKIRHAKNKLAQEQLDVLHAINELLLVILQLISTPTGWKNGEETMEKLTLDVFHLTEIYNWSLHSLRCQLDQGDGWTGHDHKDDIDGSHNLVAFSEKIRIFIQIRNTSTNDSSVLQRYLKPLPAAPILHSIAQKRASLVSLFCAKTVWKNLHESDPKSTERLKLCFQEDIFRLELLSKIFLQVPALVGSPIVLKNGESGGTKTVTIAASDGTTTNESLKRKLKSKLSSVYYESLWSYLRDMVDDLLLWGFESCTPLSFLPLETIKVVRRSLIALFIGLVSVTGSYLIPALDSWLATIESYFLLSSWDHKMQNGLESAGEIKLPESVKVGPLTHPSQWATEIGLKFGNMVSTCLSQIQKCRTKESTSAFLSTPTQTSGKGTINLRSDEDASNGIETLTLFRFEATLQYYRDWSVKRAKVWLNRWSVPQFLACSQRDPTLLLTLIKSHEALLRAHDDALVSPISAVRLTAKYRKMCADAVLIAVETLHTFPEELLQSIGTVGHTLGMVTLQSHFPNSAHWKSTSSRSKVDTEAPSPYVQIFIGKVLQPVTDAAAELVTEHTQVSIGKQIVHAACNAWLDFILQKRIKFSEWGAVQLLRDFTAVREWISADSRLSIEARRSVLQLEILKRCEGVAYLLLRTPGDTLGVGKSSSRNRRSVSGATGSNQSTPVASGNSVAENDIIPPEMYVTNQQLWLQLRFRRGFFTACCQFDGTDPRGQSKSRAQQSGV